MHYRRLVLLAILSALLAASNVFGADWSMGRFGPDQSGYTDEQVKLPLALMWQYQTTAYENNTVSPVVSNGVCYFASGATVFAVDASTGSLKWKYPKEKTLDGNVRGTLCVYDGHVFFGSGDKNIYCLDASTGAIQWFLNTGGAVRTAPIVTDSGMLIVGSDDNTVRALDPATGKSMWQKPFIGTDDISVGIAASSSIVVVSSMDGNTYGLNLTNGKPKWQYRLPSAPGNNSPVIAGDIVLMTFSNKIMGISLRSGQLKWQLVMPSDVTANPVVVGDSFYFTCNNNKMYAYSFTIRDPIAKWESPVSLKLRAATSPIAAGNTIFLMCREGMIFAYDIETGNLKWNYTCIDRNSDISIVPVDVRATPTISNGSLYIMPTNGRLFCLTADAPDNEKPYALGMYPNIEQPISGVPPIQLSVTVADMGSGVDFSSIVLTLDGKTIPFEIDYKKYWIAYKVKASTGGLQTRVLEEGKHILAVKAKDYFGTELYQEWEFKVDAAILPPAPNQELGPISKEQPMQYQPGGNIMRPGGGNINMPGRGGGGNFPGAPGGGRIDMPPPPPPMMGF